MTIFTGKAAKVMDIVADEQAQDKRKIFRDRRKQRKAVEAKFGDKGKTGERIIAERKEAIENDMMNKLRALKKRGSDAQALIEEYGEDAPSARSFLRRNDGGIAQKTRVF